MKHIQHRRGSASGIEVDAGSCVSPWAASAGLEEFEGGELSRSVCESTEVDRLFDRGLDSASREVGSAGGEAGLRCEEAGL